MDERPIEYCYWVEPDKFLAGECPRREKDNEADARDKVAALTDAGITVFIDLTEEGEVGEEWDPLLPYNDWLDSDQTYYRFPIKDGEIPDSPEITTDILDTIDEHITKGDFIYLHCRGGSGRTGTIVGCWLARHGYSGPAALARLKKLWAECPKSSRYRPSPDNEYQAQYVREWNEEE